MRFVDFLKTTVLLSGGAATALGVITILAAREESQTLLAAAVGWWVVAAVVGSVVGRRTDANPPIARLLASARTTSALPEQRPGAVLMNRLWPLLVFLLLAGGLAFLAPQIPGLGTGFAIIWALAWRGQDAAVSAIEERDGVRFWIVRTSPVRPIKLQRTPGLKAVRPESVDGVRT